MALEDLELNDSRQSCKPSFEVDVVCFPSIRPATPSRSGVEADLAIHQNWVGDEKCMHS